MHESEWQTRKQRIDTRLRSLSPAWEIVPWRAGLDMTQLDRCAVTEIPTAHGPADYGLFVTGRFLGILEAKQVTVSPQNVLEQAKRYSRGALGGVGNWHGYRVPFLFATNGEIIWFLDVRNDKAASRILSTFHTAPALDALFAFDPKSAFDWLLDTPPDHITRLRDYQRRCNIATEQAIIAGRREILLALATGTGKTFLTVAQIYRLLESKLVRRILFLVDRKALAAQAIREFNAFTTPKGNKFAQEYEVYSQRFQKEDFGDDAPFDPKVLPNGYLTGPKPSHTFVYVSTIQRMARNLFGAAGCFPQTTGDADYEDDALCTLPIPIHAFDLIVADECHRGYTAQEMSIWRATVTRPFLCRGDDGRQYYVKGRGAGNRALISEWLAGHLGLSLGLPIPPFGQAVVSADLVEFSARDDIHELGAGVGFGSQLVASADELTYPFIERIDPRLRATILLFDWWVCNSDRTLSPDGGNPNLLWSHRDQQPYVIDHNLAFSESDMVGFWDDHLFRASLAEWTPPFREAMSRRMTTAMTRVPQWWREMHESWTEIGGALELSALQHLLSRSVREPRTFWRSV
ncbi:MAG TPA: DEAD/DEAH box helicase family protein [Verrucomicrobiota bacterium]|nr:DEAD/DEAH box helicase family protein [Verrucomicrobiota bacterium]